MDCFYFGEFEAFVDGEGFVTSACFHPESGNDLEHPTDCPAEFGRPCLFKGGPFKEAVKTSSSPG